MLRLTKSVAKSAAKAVYHDPEVRRLAAKHPKVFYWIKQRLTPDQEFGLHLTIGVLLTFVFIYFFFKILQDLIGVDPLVQSDLRFITLLQYFRNSTFNHVMLFCTYLGKSQIISAGVALACLFFLIYQRWHYLIALLASVLGGEVFVWLIKNLVERPRPELVNALTPEAGYSFPSGHSFVAFSFYGLLCYVVFRASHKWWLKLSECLAALLIIILIGFSRIYLGVHYPTDVLASYASGAAWLTVIITGLEINRRLQGKYWKQQDKVPKGAPAFGSLLALLWVGYTFLFYSGHPLPARAEPGSQILTETISISDLPTKLFTLIPKASETITGKHTEPINIVIVGTRVQMEKLLNDSSWHVSDRIDWQSIKRMAVASLHNQPYPQAPGLPTFWDGNVNEYSFDQPTSKNSIRERNHIHIWSTPITTELGQQVWVGTAHFDKGIRFDAQLLLPIHATDPAVDVVRGHIKDSFLKTNEVESWQELQVVGPTLGENGTGDQFFTDGKADLFFLKNE